MSGKEFRSLFIGDLSVHCTEKDIYAVFQACGPIESVKVKQAFSHQMHSAYGFVTYMTEESAQRAMETLQGALLLGRPLKYVALCVLSLAQILIVSYPLG